MISIENFIALDLSCWVLGLSLFWGLLEFWVQKFDIWPILVRVDYSPCRVDLAALRGGKYVELVNLVPWKVFLLFSILFSFVFHC